MLEHKDYISSLNKARKKRNQNIDPRYLLILLAAVIVVGIIILGVKAAMKEPASGRAAGNRPSQQAAGAATSPDSLSISGPNTSAVCSRTP